ncbi:MAG: ATP-binding cassette domain-containing protein [Candidatus Magnetoovum sp. WYHC-5]|nr:ATP-binding cassette domain-containing protein [Candidatus Magnetoovum sp. WYHC-5]
MENGLEIVSVLNLQKYYTTRSGFLGRKNILKAVDDVSFKIKKDKVFALVGESGCGKSTVARTILLLTEKTAGTIFFNNRDISTLKGKDLKAYRRFVQIIFQDPFASLNPRMRIYDTLSEPLKVHKTVPVKMYKERVATLLDQVGLNHSVMNRYPHEFSGGQRQRICIARALALSPGVIVADEPLSSLDVSIQAQILNLLKELKVKNSLSFLFISHDLNIVQYFSDEVGVMYLGKIVEQAPSEELFSKPMHPYTEMLLNCIPKINRLQNSSNGYDDKTDTPSPLNIPKGCPFHPRCPKRLKQCELVQPVLKEYNGRAIACHLYLI